MNWGLRIGFGARVRIKPGNCCDAGFMPMTKEMGKAISIFIALQIYDGSFTVRKAVVWTPFI